MPTLNLICSLQAYSTNILTTNVLSDFSSILIIVTIPSHTPPFFHAKFWNGPSDYHVYVVWEICKLKYLAPFTFTGEHTAKKVIDVNEDCRMHFIEGLPIR